MEMTDLIRDSVIAEDMQTLAPEKDAVPENYREQVERRLAEALASDLYTGGDKAIIRQVADGIMGSADYDKLILDLQSPRTVVFDHCTELISGNLHDWRTKKERDLFIPRLGKQRWARCRDRAEMMARAFPELLPDEQTVDRFALTQMEYEYWMADISRARAALYTIFDI